MLISDDSDEENEEINFYSEGLSNHATSYVPSQQVTITHINHQVSQLGSILEDTDSVQNPNSSRKAEDN